jgi:hypothetical protein
MPALCGQECCHRPPDDLACREVVLGRMSPKIAREALRHFERNRNRVLGNRRCRSARSRQFEIAIGLSPRQAELARQRHGSLRHASSVREQPPRRSQSVGLLCSRRTNHMTQRYYRLRRKSTTFLPRKPTIGACPPLPQRSILSAVEGTLASGVCSASRAPAKASSHSGRRGARCALRNHWAHIGHTQEAGSGNVTTSFASVYVRGAGGWCPSRNILKNIRNLRSGTTCRYHMPYVVAVVQVRSRTRAIGRHHPFAPASKQCSLIGEYPVRRSTNGEHMTDPTGNRTTPSPRPETSPSDARRAVHSARAAFMRCPSTVQQTALLLRVNNILAGDAMWMAEVVRQLANAEIHDVVRIGHGGAI